MSARISVVMPCLNEAETLERCILKVQSFLSTSGIAGEIIVADNGSTDGSIDIATGLGVRVIHVKERGYGSASIAGIRAAQNPYIITADTDDSHDLEHLMPFIEALNSGFDLVLGNRFKGERKKASMNLLHRYLGVPLLTFIGNLFFKTKVGDFHCGLRGIRRAAIEPIDLVCKGMEFSSEIIVKSALNGLQITEVPTTVYPSGRSRRPHLRSFPDGWRHLRFLLLYSPRWLFLYPGLGLMVLSFYKLMHLWISGGVSIATSSPLILWSLLYLVGFQCVLFFALTKIYGSNHGLLPKSDNYEHWFKIFTLEKGLLAGLTLIFTGGLGVVLGVYMYAWLPTYSILPLSIIVVMGVQLILFSFFFSMMGLAPNTKANA